MQPLIPNGAPCTMLALLPDTAHEIDPRLGLAYPGPVATVPPGAGSAVVGRAIDQAAHHSQPLVIDCPDRATAGTVIALLGAVSDHTGHPLGVVTLDHPGGCQVRAVVPDLDDLPDATPRPAETSGPADG